MTSQWNEIRNRYNKLEIVKMLYREYLKTGNWGEVAKTFGVSHVHVRKLIKTTTLDNEGYKLKLQADKKLIELRVQKLNNGRKNIDYTKRKINYKKPKRANESEIIEYLKKECTERIKYDDFLWIVIGSKNENLSTEKWLKYAASAGIKVLL